MPDGPDGTAAASAKRRRRFKSYLANVNNLLTWKSLLFLWLLITSVILGVKWQAYGAPAKPLDRYSAPPQNVEIYVSDPSAEVTLTAHVIQVAGANTASVAYYLSIAQSKGIPFVDWLVISDGASTSSSADRLYNEPIYDGYQYNAAPIDEQVFEGNTLSITQNPTGNAQEPGYFIGETLVPGGVMTSGGGELFADLPEVASEDTFNNLAPTVTINGASRTLQPQWYNMAVLVEKSATNVNHEAIINSPQPLRAVTAQDLIPGPSLFPALVSSPFYEPFYVPENIHTRVIMEGLASTLQEGYQVSYSYPSDYQLSNGSVIWNGDLSLNPTILATDVDAEQSRANYDFYAGIALAVAAAAFIALIQEIDLKRLLKSATPGEAPAQDRDPGSPNAITSGPGTGAGTDPGPEDRGGTRTEPSPPSPRNE